VAGDEEREGASRQPQVKEVLPSSISRAARCETRVHHILEIEEMHSPRTLWYTNDQVPGCILGVMRVSHFEAIL